MRRLQQPIVLIHGFGAQNAYGPVDYFYGLLKPLRQAGNLILAPQLPAWSTHEERGLTLRFEIEKWLSELGKRDAKINLIGHSLGGLDARYLTSCLEFGHRVASVTTIGTPHHGTSLCDVALGAIPGIAFDLLKPLLEAIQCSEKSIRQLSPQACGEVFTRRVPNIQGVRYFSATTRIGSPLFLKALPIFWPTAPLLQRLEGDNDGFVSVKSAHWGELICVHEGDHYAQIGQICGNTRGLDHLKFFEEILERLQSEGL